MIRDYREEDNEQLIINKPMLAINNKLGFISQPGLWFMRKTIKLIKEEQ